MANKYPKQLFNVLEDSPYWLDKLRFFGESNEERKDTDLYDLTNETRSTILWEFKQ